MSNPTRILIVGGGLSGLTLAYLLSQHQINPVVLEASPRIGGRVKTINGPLGTPLELGATWFSSEHLRINALMDELGLEKHPQLSGGISLFETTQESAPQKFSVPDEESSSFRIVGGTQSLTDALLQKLNPENLHLNSKVSKVESRKDTLMLQTSTGESFEAEQVILCLPPQVISSEITFSPTLPEPVPQLLPNVQTWMAGSIKFVLEFEEAFWRKKGYSGMAFSHVGIISEMYDHSNADQSKFGFTGFLNGESRRLSPEERRHLVLQHLGELFEEKIPNPSFYQDQIWTDRLVLGENPIITRPHQYNGHPLLLQSYFNEKLFFAGTETSTEFAGYMEGAIRSAERVAGQILKIKG